MQCCVGYSGHSVVWSDSMDWTQIIRVSCTHFPVWFPLSDLCLLVGLCTVLYLSEIPPLPVYENGCGFQERLAKCHMHLSSHVNISSQGKWKIGA